MTTAVRIKRNDVRSIMAESGRHPVLFMAAILGMDLWDMPMEIADAVWQDRSDVAVKGCHACSKTYTTAGIVLHHVLSYPDGGVITTAPTWEQVKRVMWAEIKKAIRRSGISFPRVNETEVRASEDESNRLVGISTNDATRFQGYHGNMLIVVDEAPGVFGELHDAIEGIRAAGNVKKLQLGNPTIAVGPFYDAFTKQSASGARFSISCMDTPNFVGVELADLISRDERDPYLDECARDYLITRRSVWRLAHEYGVDSQIFQARALAQFPTQASDSVFPLGDLERCKLDAVMDYPERAVAGIDVAGGGRDQTVITIRRGAQVLEQRAFQGDARGPAINMLTPYRDRGDLACANIDSTGMGYYFAGAIEDARIVVERYDFGTGAEPRTNEGRKQFEDTKAEIYWRFRELLQGGLVRGLDRVPEAYRQLTQLRYGTNNRTGAIRMESKDVLKKRLRGSPDEAESVILAFQKPKLGTFTGQPARRAGTGSRQFSPQSAARRSLFGAR